MSDEDRRSLKVKAGVVKRLRKELDMYAAEVATETAKVQQLRDAGADPHDIKYQVGGCWGMSCWNNGERVAEHHGSLGCSRKRPAHLRQRPPLARCFANVCAERNAEAQTRVQHRQAAAGSHTVSAVTPPLLVLTPAMLLPKLPSRACPPPLPPPPAQENILAESSAMLPDTRQRLEEAFRELQGLVVSPARMACFAGTAVVCGCYQKHVTKPRPACGWPPKSCIQVELQSRVASIGRCLKRGPPHCCRRS